MESSLLRMSSDSSKLFLTVASFVLTSKIFIIFILECVVEEKNVEPRHGVARSSPYVIDM